MHWPIMAILACILVKSTITESNSHRYYGCKAVAIVSVQGNRQQSTALSSVFPGMKISSFCPVHRALIAVVASLSLPLDSPIKLLESPVTFGLLRGGRAKPNLNGPRTANCINIQCMYHKTVKMYSYVLGIHSELAFFIVRSVLLHRIVQHGLSYTRDVPKWPAIRFTESGL